MIELSINNLTKYYGATKIFENISFDLKTGERIGFIGQNGCGKTTIMKILMGQEDYQGGEITFRKDARVGYLNQIPDYDENTKTMEVIQSAFEDIFTIKNKMRELEGQFSSLEGSELEKVLLKYGRVTDEFERNGGYEIETRMNKVTEGLDITEIHKAMNFNELSGGEKTRVILAKILLEEPDILLLDEPTNHLDLMTIDWLEGFLSEYKGSVLIISHDRFFLDKVVNRIVWLEFSKVNNYLGNYSYYVEEKERRFLIEYKNYLSQQKKIEQMERQIERYRIWGAMRDSEKMYKKAKELEKRLDKIDVLDKPKITNRKIRLGLNPSERSGKIVIEAEQVAKSYEHKELLQNLSLTIYYQDSACIIGKNGCGKSTLLKMILGEIGPDNGAIKLGAGVTIGYLPQEVIFEKEEQTILEYFTDTHDTTYEIARSHLARGLFYKEDVNKKIKHLSGGEKSRLRICSLTFREVNLMILDEPTNHLDIDSREVLEEMLSEFEGTILFVSHDRYFINKIADKILSVEDKNIKIYGGDYSYYLEEYQKLQEQESIRQENENKNKKKMEQNTSYSTKEQRNQVIHTSDAKNKEHSHRLEELEKQIESLENTIKSLDKLMEDHSTNVTKLEEIYLEKEEGERKLLHAYEEWEKLQS